MLKAGAWALAGVMLLAMQPPAAGITVSAAASLTDAMEAVARAYEAEGGGPVQFNFAGSNVLARQIASGAPVDVFVSADRTQMDVAARAGAIDGATRVDLLGNRLAIVTPVDTPARHPEDLLLPAIRRIAVGDPAAVPSGVYAQQYFTRLDLWTRIEQKLVPVGNVRAALAAVENGSADAAVVFVTDASVAKGEVASFIVTDSRAPDIVYPAAIVRTSRNRAAAERFLAFLRGAQAAAIFKRYGFLPPPAPATR